LSTSAVFLLAIAPPSAHFGQRGATSLSDMSGRSVAIAMPAKKVVIFPIILSSYLTIENGTTQVQAASPVALEQAAEELLNKIYPTFYNIQRLSTIGNSAAPADPEQVMTLHPGVVFSWEEQASGLEMAGLPVMEVHLSSKNQAQSRIALWKLLGDVTNRRDRADMLLQKSMSKQVALQRSITNSAYIRPRVALLYRLGNGALGLGGKNYSLSDRLAMTDAVNVADHMRVPAAIDLEELLTLNPDIILFNSSPQDDLPEEVYRRPGWQALRAVREHKVYKMPSFAFINSAVNAPLEDPLLILWMDELFYANQLPSRLRTEFRNTYKEVYGYSIQDDEIDRIIFLKENLCSAEYQQFAR
jgi:iron complex transport system substrate-binding protein